VDASARIHDKMESFIMVMIEYGIGLLEDFRGSFAFVKRDWRLITCLYILPFSLVTVSHLC
jgi:hypothetical protein